MTGSIGEDGRQFQKSLFLIYHSPCFLRKGLLAWGLLLRLCGPTIGPFSVFAFPVLRLQEGTIILGFLQGSWGQTLGSHTCIANVLQTERSLFLAPSPHPLAWFYLAFFLLCQSIMSPPVRCHQRCIVIWFAAHLLEAMETSSQERSTVRSDKWSGMLAQHVKCANITFGSLAAVNIPQFSDFT